VFDIYFRSQADHEKYTKLNLKDRPFLLTELAEVSQGYAPLNSTRDHLSDGNDLGIHKLDIYTCHPTYICPKSSVCSYAWGFRSKDYTK
jgi:hypothetical protein